MGNKLHFYEQRVQEFHSTRSYTLLIYISLILRWVIAISLRDRFVTEKRRHGNLIGVSSSLSQIFAVTFISYLERTSKDHSKSIHSYAYPKVYQVSTCLKHTLRTPLIPQYSAPFAEFVVRDDEINTNIWCSLHVEI